MAMFWTIIFLVALVLGLGIALMGPRLRRAVSEATFARARKEFHTQREHLEAKFFEIASQSGKPRGLEWTHCDFQDDVAYARDRTSGDYLAMVGVTIRFAAIEGGGMEDVEAVGNLRAATAVFHYTADRWKTQGRAIFNLEPDEAIRHFQTTLEMVAHDLSAKV